MDELACILEPSDDIAHSPMKLSRYLLPSGLLVLPDVPPAPVLVVPVEREESACLSESACAFFTLPEMTSFADKVLA